MLSLLKLLIALNTFSYRGRFATNCSLVGWCRPPQWGPLTFCHYKDSVVGWQSLRRSVSVNLGSAKGSDLGGRGRSSRCGLLSCFIILSVFSSLAVLLPGGHSQVRNSVSFPVDTPWRPSLQVAVVAASASLTLGQEGGKED